MNVAERFGLACPLLRASGVLTNALPKQLGGDVKERTLEHSRWVLRALVLAGAYFVTGRLGLLLAIPPGFATAVWPPSGIALAALTVFGPRLWPGVLIGSFMVNLSISQQSFLSPQALVVAASIGMGASLQAAAGALLVRRFAGRPLELIHEWDIVKFLGLAGLLSCVVNPTFGVGALSLARVISWGDVLFHWWTWWVGDVIGVVIFSPLVFIWVAEPR